jgi:tetratricopeptide (TPR) repeat protein
MRNHRPIGFLAVFLTLSGAVSGEPLPTEAARNRQIERLLAQTAASPKDVGSWHYLATLLREAERWDEAIDAESRAIAVHPKYAVAFYGRGRARMEKRDYPAARADFTSAIGLWESRGGLERFLTEEIPRDEHVESYRNRGVAFAYESRFKEAVADLGTAVKLRKDDPRLLFERGHLEEKAGLKADAVASFGRAGLIYAEAHSEKMARDCADRLRKLDAGAAADAIEKKLKPRPRGNELP